MNVLAAIQSLVVLTLWLYVGRLMLARWIDDPSGDDLDLMGDGSYRQSKTHQRLQITATLAYWLAAVCCFWLAVTQLLPQQPEAATQSHKPEHHAADTSDGWAPWMASKDSPGNHALAVLVVHPLADANHAGSDRKPDQRLSQRRVVAYSNHTHQHRSRDEGQRAIPLVCAKSLSCVHGFSLSLLTSNGFPEGGRP